MPSGLPMPTVRRDRAVAHGNDETIAQGFAGGDNRGREAFSRFPGAGTVQMAAFTDEIER